MLATRRTSSQSRVRKLLARLGVCCHVASAMAFTFLAGLGAQRPTGTINVKAEAMMICAMHSYVAPLAPHMERSVSKLSIAASPIEIYLCLVALALARVKITSAFAL